MDARLVVDTHREALSFIRYPSPGDLTAQRSIRLAITNEPQRLS
jgi:hypothetical protein